MKKVCGAFVYSSFPSLMLWQLDSLEALEEISEFKKMRRELTFYTRGVICLDLIHFVGIKMPCGIYKGCLQCIKIHIKVSSGQ